MSVDIATLGIKVDASDVKDAGRDLDNLADKGKRAEGSAKGVTSAFNDLKSALAILGIGAVARELGQMADTYKNIQGKLGLVTSGTAELAQVSDKLFNIAQRTRTEFEAVTDLYGSLARSTKALGTSQGELLQVTETINQALIVSGANAASSEAALRQLGQGFASGALRGDELNSVLENTPRLAQAIADGMGVTVGQLRKLGAEGKITGEAVFNALKSQRETIEKEFATMPVTISQSFVQLRNEVLKYVGEADAANGASAAFSAGVQALSKNLDSAVYAIEILVVAYGVKLVASFVAATAAAIAQQAALLGLTTAAEVTGFAIGLLAARLAALSVVGAIAFAIVGFATETAKANAAVAQANRSFDEMKKRLDTAGGGATQAAGHVGGLGKDALGSIPKIDSFAGRVGNAAQQLYGMARAARAARVEMLQTQLEQSQKNELQLASQTPGGRNASAADFRRGDFLNNAGIIGRAFVGSARSVLSGGRTDREAEDAYGKQVQVSLDLMRRLREAKGAPITAEDVPGGGGTPTASGAGGGKTKGGGGKSQAQQEAEQRLKSSQDYLRALTEETQAIGLNEVETHRLEVAREAARAPTEALRNSIIAAGNAWETATVKAEADRKATEEATRAKEEAERANTQQLKDAKAMADALEFDTKLQGMNAREREVAIATREMEMRGIVAGTAAYAQYAAAIISAANAKGQLKLDADNAQQAADHIAHLNDNVQDAAKSFADLFDGAGKGFADLVTTLGDYYQFQADQEAKLAEVRARYGDQSREYQQAEIDAREAATNHELETYGRVLSGVKNLFSQKSAAYKVMEGIEKAYAAVRLAMAIKEILTETILTTAKVGGASARMATDGVETASSVAKSGIRAAADGVAAFAKTLASLPFPLNLVAGAAVLAALVAVGVKVAGGGGKKSASAEAAATVEKTPVYTGAYDEYGNPTSDYSVLRRGKTTVSGANDNASYSSVDVGTSGASGQAGGLSIRQGDLIVQGNLDSDVLPQVQQMLEQNNERVVQDARAAVAADNAARANRQRIGGGK